MIFGNIMPLPDENIYSILVRLAKVRGIKYFFDIKKHVIDKPTKMTVFNISESILCGKNLSNYFNVEYKAFMFNHSYEQYWRPFYIARGTNTVNRYVKNIYNIFDIRRKKYCEDCLSDDVMEYGVAYWHRAHDLPGIEFCYKHGQPLLTQNIRGRSNLLQLPSLNADVEYDNRYEYYSEEDINIYSPLSPLYCVEDEIEYSNMCYDFLCVSSAEININLLLIRYIYDLERDNIFTVKGGINYRVFNKILEKSNLRDLFKDNVINFMHKLDLYLSKREKQSTNMFGSFKDHIGIVKLLYGNVNNLIDECIVFQENVKYEKFKKIIYKKGELSSSDIYRRAQREFRTILSACY